MLAWDQVAPSKVSAVIVALLVIFALGIGPSTPEPARVSSREALLAPHFRVGAVYTWYASVTEVPTRWMISRCTNCGPSSHSYVLACTVTGEDRGAFAFTRRVRAFIPGQPPSPILEHPSISILDGHAFKADGTHLNDDPLCSFYSPELYGTPPTTLAVGTTWRFRRPSNFGYLAGLHGTVIVSNVDAPKDTVSLQISANGAGSVVIDMTVSDGGVIENESDRWDSSSTASASPKFIAQPTDLVILSAQRPLASLWAYPPNEIVPFRKVPDLFDSNGSLVSVWQLPTLGQKITLVRIWRFGPFALESLIPSPPKIRDVLLALGVVVLVFLGSRAAMILRHFTNGPNFESPRTTRRRIAVETTLALVAVIGTMWWIYH
jgi:hypothetical protein